jgi:thymidylate synthase
MKWGDIMGLGYPTTLSKEEYKMVMRSRQVKQHEEYQYLHLLEDIIETGIRTPNRTGIDTLTIPHVHISFDLQNGFPLLTHKKMAKKTFAVELEGFIKGITSKRWFQERGCKIWNEWCNPLKVPYGHDDKTKQQMMEEDDLGPIYGYQWRNFNGNGQLGVAGNHDQLFEIVEKLKKNPNDRRMICSAWNPCQLSEQALPPCHVLWNVTVIDNTINLCWFQRSCDVALGIPANIFSYSLLLHLLAKESGFKEGKVSGFLSNCHIYDNQIDGVKEAISRKLYPFPKVITNNFTSIFMWKHTDTIFENYHCGDTISMPIAV